MTAAPPVRYEKIAYFEREGRVLFGDSEIKAVGSVQKYQCQIAFGVWVFGNNVNNGKYHAFFRTNSIHNHRILFRSADVRLSLSLSILNFSWCRTGMTLRCSSHRSHTQTHTCVHHKKNNTGQVSRTTTNTLTVNTTRTHTSAQQELPWGVA